MTAELFKTTPLTKPEIELLDMATDTRAPRIISLAAQMQLLIERMNLPEGATREECMTTLVLLGSTRMEILFLDLLQQLVGMLTKDDTDAGCAICGTQCASWKLRQADKTDPTIDRTFQDIISR